MGQNPAVEFDAMMPWRKEAKILQTRAFLSAHNARDHERPTELVRGSRKTWPHSTRDAAWGLNYVKNLSALCRDPFCIVMIQQSTQVSIAAPMIGGVITPGILKLLFYPVIHVFWRKRNLGTPLAA